MKTKNEISKIRTEIQTLINSKAKFCWHCGRTNHLTSHHAIPQRLRGTILNIKIPVCDTCKEVIHMNDFTLKLIKRIFGLG